jgi:hypothetical protein
MFERTDEQQIPRELRRDLLDLLSMENVVWSGRLGDLKFLDRLYDLEDLPSGDGRFADAAGDIWQHTENNPSDWERDWVFSDERFDLIGCSDERFLAFLCLTVHPVVRADDGERQELVALYNDMLAEAGIELAPAVAARGRRPIYEPRGAVVRKAPTMIFRRDYEHLDDPAVLHEHLKRIEAGLAADPAAAIGSSKELVESVCKLILDDYGISYAKEDSLLDLYKKVADAMALSRESVPESAKGSEAARRVLQNLATTVQSMAELRNELGLGHGKTKTSAVEERHGRLAFNAAQTVAEFLLDTWHARKAMS